MIRQLFGALRTTFPRAFVASCTATVGGPEPPRSFAPPVAGPPATLVLAAAWNTPTFFASSMLFAIIVPSNLPIGATIIGGGTVPAFGGAVSGAPRLGKPILLLSKYVMNWPLPRFA